MCGNSLHTYVRGSWEHCLFCCFCVWGGEDVDNASYWTFGEIMFFISSQYEFINAKRLATESLPKSFPTMELCLLSIDCLMVSQRLVLLKPC